MRKIINLSDKLAAELPGILNWALKGCLDWQQSGLQRPASIVAAVKQYQADMDTIATWIGESCEVGTEYKELLSVLYANYKNYAQTAQEHLFSQREFAQYLTEHNFVKKQTTATSGILRQKGWYIIGIKLEKPKFTK